MKSLRNLSLLTALSLFSLFSNTIASPASQSDNHTLLSLANNPETILSLNWTGDPCLQPWPGLQCDENGKITALDLSSRKLSNLLLPELGNLSSLRLLNLSHNSLTGPLPPQLSKLSYLEILDLSNNNFTGTVPSSLISLLDLKVLYLSNNNLSGSIPALLTSLSNLQKLDLSTNRLSGPIPPNLSSLSNLIELNLAMNNLSGPIPPQFRDLSQLQTLNLGRNSLTGPIPVQLSFLSNLLSLHLHMNSLTGQIPPELSHLSHLTALSLFLNNLSGPIPPQLGALSNLATLALQQNSLTGAIPPQLGQLSKLKHLGLFQNNLTGPLPAELFTPLNLTAVSIAQNWLTGPIPEQAGMLPSLTFLDLSQNFLNGSVPLGLRHSFNSSTPSMRISVRDNNVRLATDVYSSLALNCLGINPMNFYEVEQRDSQICAQFYPELRCRCEASQVIGINGSCYCVTPLQIKLLFVFNDNRSARNFSMGLTGMLCQLADTLSVNVKRLAPVRFEPSFGLQTVTFVINILPDNSSTSLTFNEVAKYLLALQQPSNVTVPGFNLGFFFLGGRELAPSTPSIAPSVATHKQPGNGGRTATIVALAVMVVVATAAACAHLWARQKKAAVPPAVRTLIPGSSTKSWSFSELWDATEGFSEKRMLGRGGFGTVYKGDIDGEPVAVKRLEPGARQGHDEFVKEVEIIGSIHHRNLVNLKGYCIEGEERLLVYELMANGSLQDWLFEDTRDLLPWSACMSILADTARAISYLHHDCQAKIIHRDIKPANILLDSEFKACVSDFGLARSALPDETHVSTQVMGTFGFLDPEYALTGQLTEKSDVYSFGVLMLAVISNRWPLNNSVAHCSWVGLVDAAFTANKENRLLKLVSPHFGSEHDREEAMQVMSIALLCLQRRSHMRPSMKEVLSMLSGQEASRSLSETSFPWTSTSSPRSSLDFELPKLDIFISTA